MVMVIDDNQIVLICVDWIELVTVTTSWVCTLVYSLFFNHHCHLVHSCL